MFQLWTTEIYNAHCHSSPQVEVFQFQIEKFDDIERRELYGKIEVSALNGCLTLYHRDREFPEHICANSTLSLIGFPRSILNVLGFGINIDLRLRSNNDNNENDSNDVVLFSYWTTCFTFFNSSPGAPLSKIWRNNLKKVTHIGWIRNNAHITARMQKHNITIKEKGRHKNRTSAMTEQDLLCQKNTVYRSTSWHKFTPNSR